MGLKAKQNRKINNSVSLPEDLWDKIDLYIKNGSEDSRSGFFLKRVEDFFFNIENTDKPKTIKDSVKRWLFTGEWIDPIEKV